MKNYLIRKELRDMTPEQREQWRAERRAGTRRGELYDATARKIAEGYEAQGVQPEFAAELGASPVKRKAYEAEQKERLAAWRADHPQEDKVNDYRTVMIPEVTFGRFDGHDIAGAHAVLDDQTSSRHTLTRVVTVVGAFTKKKTGHGVLTVTFADGHVWSHPLVSPGNMRRVSQWAAAFNAYAGALTG